MSISNVLPLGNLFGNPTSLYDKYAIEFRPENSVCSPSIHDESIITTCLLDLSPLSSLDTDWFPHRLRKKLSYRVSFWTSSTQRLSSDVVINLKDISTKGNLYALDIRRPITNEDIIILSIDLVYKDANITVAHGNIQFQIVRNSDENPKNITLDTNVPPPKKTLNTVFKRKLNRLIVIKNMTTTEEDNEDEEIVVNEPANPTTQRRNVIHSILQSQRIFQQQIVPVINPVVVNFSYVINVTLQSNDWLPKLFASSSSKFEAKKPTIDVIIPSFNASFGVVKSSTGPTQWKLNRKFQVFPPCVPSPREILICDSIFRFQAQDSHSMSALINFDEVLLDSRKLYVTVDDVQLSPDMLEHYKAQKLVAYAFCDDKHSSRAFLGGIQGMEGRWQPSCLLRMSSSSTAVVITIRIVLLSTSTRTSNDDSFHIYNLLAKNENISETIICEGMLTRMNLIGEEEPKNGLLTSGRYEVVLTVNDHETSSMFIVGKMQLSVVTINGDDSSESHDILPLILSPHPLPRSITEAYGPTISEVFDNLSISEILSVLSSCCARLLSVRCDGPVPTLAIHVDSPLSILSDDSHIKKLTHLMKFWGFQGDDDLSLVYAVMTSIFDRLSTKIQFRDIVTYDLLIQRMHRTGTVASFWLFFQEWLTLPTMNTLLQQAKYPLSQSTESSTVTEFTADDWKKLRCATWCLRVLGDYGKRYGDVGVSRRNEPSVELLSEDLLYTTAYFALRSLTNAYKNFIAIINEDVDPANVISKQSSIAAEHDERKKNEKSKAFEVIINYVHRLIANLVEAVSPLASIASLAVNITQAVESIILTILKINTIVFEQYSTNLHIKELSSRIIDENKQSYYQQRLLARVKMTFVIRSLLGLVNRIYSNRIIDIFEKHPPPSWSKRDQFPTIEKNLGDIYVNVIESIGAFVKSHYRHYIMSTNEYKSMVSHASTLLDEVDLLQQELTSVIQVFDSQFLFKFRRLDPMLLSTSKLVDIEFLKYVGMRSPLLAGVQTLLEAHVTINCGVMKLSRVLSETPKDNSLFSYLTNKFENSGKAASTTTDYYDNSNIDDEMMIVSWLPMIHFQEMKVNTLAYLLQSQSPTALEIRKAFDDIVGEESSDITYFLLMFISYFLKATQLFWQALDHRLESIYPLQSGRDKDFMIALSTFWTSDASLLIAATSSLFLCVLYDNASFHPDEISIYSTERLMNIQSDPPSRYRLWESNDAIDSSIDNYIGLQYHERLFGGYFVEGSSVLSWWLQARFSYIAAFTSLIRSAVISSWIDVQRQLPMSQEDILQTFDRIEIASTYFPQLITSLIDVALCRPLIATRQDMVLLCLKESSDGGLVIRTFFDLACYLPVFNRNDYLSQLISLNVDTKGSDISSSALSLKKAKTKRDLFDAVANYYNIVSDSRYNMLVGIFHVMQMLSSPTTVESFHSLYHQDVFLRVFYRAVLCSLPSETIIDHCPALVHIFRNEYKFKQLILSNCARSLYQQGSGQVVQGIFAILELPSSINDIHIVSLREDIYCKLTCIRMYVMAKLLHSFRIHVSNSGFNDMYAYIFALPSSGHNSALASKITHLLGSRFDVLAMISALHTLLRWQAFEDEKKQVNLVPILQELINLCQHRVNDFGGGDIRLNIPQSLRNNDPAGKYIDISETFLGNVNVHASYMKLPVEYRQALGVRTDPVEELGKNHSSMQSLLQLHYQDTSADSIPTNTEAYEGDIHRFTEEGKREIHGLESEHMLSRKIIQNFIDVGDWESGFVYVDKILKKYADYQARLQAEVKESLDSSLNQFGSKGAFKGRTVNTKIQSHQSYMIFRLKTLQKELMLNQDRIRSRLAHDGEIRVLPLFYAIRFCPESPWGGGHESSDVVNFLEVDDFLRATSLSFHGVATTGSFSDLGRVEKNVEAMEGIPQETNEANQANDFAEEMKVENDAEADDNEKVVEGLGQGTWIILRYDPSSYVAATQLYRKFVDERKHDESARFDVPMPPPSYASVLSKLHEAFPHYRILSSTNHFEKDSSEAFNASRQDSEFTADDKNVFREPMTIQLFEIFPVELCQEEIFKEDEKVEGTARDSNRWETEEGLDSYKNSPLSKTHRAITDLLDTSNDDEDTTAKENKSNKSTFLKAYHSQRFFVFAFEDESKEHFYRAKLGSEDDLSCPRMVRFTLVLDWNYISFVEPSHDLSSAAASIIFSRQDQLDRTSLAWMAPCSVAFIHRCKRVSFIEALIQLLHYYNAVLNVLSNAMQHSLSLSSKEYSRQQPDDIVHTDTVLVAVLSFLANALLVPGATAVGLHNADVLIAAEMEHQELLWQQQRKEIRRNYFRAVSDYDELVKDMNKFDRKNVPKPPEPNYRELEEKFFAGSAYLLTLDAKSKALSRKCMDVCQDMRAFVDKLGTMVSKAEGNLMSPMSSTVNQSTASNALANTTDVVVLYKTLLLWLEANYAAANIGYAI